MQLEQNYGRYEWFLEQPSLRALYGPQYHNSLPWHPFTSAYNLHRFDRFGTLVDIVGGGGGAVIWATW